MDMELNPAERFTIKDFFRPGCLIGTAGALLIAGCILKYAWANHNVDLAANPELVATGGSIKAMVWIVVGIGLSLFGALLTYIDFSRR